MIDELPMPEIHNPHQSVNLFAQFYMRDVQDNKKSDEEGRPIFKEQEFVRIMIPGDKSNIIDRPVRIGRTERHDNVRFASQYKNFKSGLEQAPVGTPLSEWVAITTSQAKELEHFHIKTVEQLSEMPDTAAQNFRGIMVLREKAKNWLQRAKDDAPNVKLEAAIKEKDDQLAAMQKQMAEMAEELKELQKPKRGRPPKDD